MAALFRNSIFLQNNQKHFIINKNILYQCYNGYATKAEKRKGIDRKPIPKLDATAQSIAAKGFLRPQRQYVPKENVEKILSEIFNDILGEEEEKSLNNLNTKISDLNVRFKLFASCANILGYTIPNSLLHQIETVEDIIKFYVTPVDIRTPLERMRTMDDLPPNLNIQFEYKRWNPADDDKFQGITAFPESSTIVTGLKYKDKYKGHVQKIKHPEY